MIRNSSTIENLPRFIAIKYQYMLDCEGSSQQVYQAALGVFEICMRFMAIYLTSQYLRWDRDSVRKRKLNDLLDPSMKYGDLETVSEIVKTTFQVYKKNQKGFFIPELFNFYWDTSHPDRYSPRENILKDIKTMMGFCNDLSSAKELPKNEKEWKARAAESIEIADRLVAELSFLKNYEILWISAHDEAENVYTAQLHKGPGVKQVKFRYEGDLRPGWIYVGRDRKAFLRLDPLIQYTGEEETAIYRELKDNCRLQYLVLTGEELVEKEDDNLIEEFFNLLVTIENVKRDIPVEEELDWSDLESLAKILSQSSASAIRKVDQSLYLQREYICTLLLDYLKSDVPCFVLTGRSGAGKSSFVLSMINDIDAIKQDEDLCPLFFSAPQLGERLTESITEALYQCWEKSYTPGAPSIWQIVEPMVRARRQRKILLIIDAVNEHPNPQKLFEEIFKLLGMNKSWLKIVMTSRPEALELLSKNVNINTINNLWFYQPALSGEFAVDQKIPLAACEVLPFSAQELPLVYQKYQDHYRLKTDFEEINSQDILDLIRDPFYLWILAENYEGKPLPYHATRYLLIDQFVEGLRGGGDKKNFKRGHLLDEEDIAFLEEELVPLFLPSKNELYVQPSITRLIRDSKRSDDLKNQGLYSSGKYRNPILRLSEAKIIHRSTDGISTTINFQHDKFLEYFLGNYLHQQMPDWFDHNITQGYRDLIDSELMDKAVFTGIVQNSLHQHLNDACEKGSLPVDFRALCVNTNPMVKLVVVPALTSFYYEDEDKKSKEKKSQAVVKDILNALAQTPITAKTRQNHDDLNAALAAHEIALETACHLGLTGMLVSALTSRQAEVRELGIRYTYLLDRIEAQKTGEPEGAGAPQQMQKSFLILQEVGKQLGQSFVRHGYCFGAFTQLSVLLLIEHMDEEFAKDRQQCLVPIVLNTIRQIGHFGNKKKTFLDQAFQFVLMTLVLNFVITALKFMARFPRRKVAAWEAYHQDGDESKPSLLAKEKNFFDNLFERFGKKDQKEEDIYSSAANYEVFSAFYKTVPEAQRETARKLSLYMDLTYPKTYEEVEALLVEGFTNSNCMTTTLGNAIASAWGTIRPEKITELSEKIYQADQKEHTGWEVALDAAIVWYQAIKRQKYREEDRQQWEAWLNDGKAFIQNIIDNDPHGYGRFKAEGKTYEQYPLLFYMAIYNRINPGSPNDLLDEYIQRAMEKMQGAERERLLIYLADSLGDRRAYLVNYAPVLKSFEPFIPKDKESPEDIYISEPFTAHLAASLAGIRGVFMQQVDNFLISVGASKQFMNQVVRMSYERQSSVIYLRVADFAYDLLIHGNDRMRAILVQIAHELTYARSFEDALRKIGFYVVKKLNETA